MILRKTVLIRASAVDDVYLEIGCVENLNDTTTVLSILFRHRIVKYVFYIRQDGKSYLVALSHRNINATVTLYIALHT